MVSASTPNARPNRYSERRCESTLQEIFASYRLAAREELAAVSQAQADEVNDQSQASRRIHIDRLFDDRFSNLLRQVESHFQRELTVRFSTQLDAAVSLAVSEAVEQTRRSTRRHLSQELNLVVRRLRAAGNLEELTKVLVDSTLPFCGRAAIFTVEDTLLHGAEIRGVEAQSIIENFSCLHISLTQAHALANCVESNDTVVSLNSPTEVSAAMVKIFDDAEKVYLFPVTAGATTVAILYAVGQVGGLPVDVPSLELLAQTAGMRWELLCKAAETTFEIARAGRSELVTIGSAGAHARLLEKAEAEPVWSNFSREERELHLRAQRFARVQVAEMRLRSGEAVRSGRARHDLYSALQPEVDSAREAFRQKFVTASRSMIDYFHIELIHNLANDDATLLGQNYPGPLA